MNVKHLLNTNEVIINEGGYGNAIVNEQTMDLVKKIINPNSDIFHMETINKKSEVSGNHPFYKALEPKCSAVNQIPNINEALDFLLSPTPVAFKTVNGRITLGLSLTAKTPAPLKNMKNLKFDYQLTLSQFGTPQMNIYVSFDKEAQPGFTESNLQFWDNIFNIIIPAGSLVNIQKPGEVEYFQVFVIQRDPRTSRGTVTTVKPTET
jgi:hypothetical protein